MCDLFPPPSCSSSPPSPPAASSPRDQGLAFLDWAVESLVRRVLRPPTLEYRVQNPKAVGLEALEVIDYSFLFINSFIEYAFALQVARFVVTTGAWSASELGLWNTAPALFLVFAIDDAFYAPTHKLMHNYRLYPYIHKHHHRQWLPARGYTDAGNEHPLEQVLGLSCLWATLQIVARLTGLHAATIVVHFTLYAALAMLNHTGCDVRVKLPGFEYTVGAHEMHHRQPNCNMAQYFMFWDKLYGTYKEYYDGADRKKVA